MARIFLLSVCLLALAERARADLQCIGPRAGSSAAVVVADSLPLVHTRQVFAGGKGTVAEQCAEAWRELETILKGAETSPEQAVKLNFVVADDKVSADIEAFLAERFAGKHRPAVSFVAGKLSAASASFAVDAVVAGKRRPTWKEVEQGEGFAILPPGTRVYVSGQAVRGKGLAEATRKTLEELEATLKFLGLKKTSVVQLKAFLQPMAESKAVVDEVKTFFAEAKRVPPIVLVEWISSLPIEIELIAWGGRERAGEPIEYLTPPGLKASPVFSRVARVNDGKLIYISGLHGKGADAAAEVVDIYEQLAKVLDKVGSDLRHLAKATYYVTGSEAVKKMDELRPRLYDPKRPPASSRAMVPGTGRAGRTATLDMIAVPSPRIHVNDYGPAERGHGLTAKMLEENPGWIALFDGQTTFGWTGAKVEKGVLTGGQFNLRLGPGDLKIEVAKGGTIRWADQARVVGGEGSVSTFRHDICPRHPTTLLLADEVQVTSIHYLPVHSGKHPIADFKRWQAIHHPKLSEDKRASWTIKGDVVRAIGGPGCLEYADERFADFVLQLDVRVNLRHANGGVFFRAMPGSFMNGYEAQVYNRCHDGDIARPWTWATGAIDDRQNARRLVSRDGDWFHYTIIAQGDRLATWINGQQTVDFLDERKEHENPRLGKRTLAGTIQLQAHDAGTDIEFRRVRVGKWK